MDKPQRLRALLAGAEGLPPLFSLWTHLPAVDRDANQLADATWTFACRHDVDVIKTMPNGMYAVEDYGCALDFTAVAEGGVARVTATPVRHPEDWVSLPKLDIGTGALGRELNALRRLLALVDGQIPVVFTVFSPLTVAAKLSRGAVFDHARTPAGQAAVDIGLASIAAVTGRLAAAAIAAGAAGVFFATQHVGRGVVSDTQFEALAVPHDIAVLQAAAMGWCTIVHLHGDDVRFFDVAERYPAQAINWHVWETPPSLADARAFTGKTLVGGLNRWSVTARDMVAVKQQIGAGRTATQGHRHLVTPGCTLRHPLDEAVLDQVRAWVRAA